MSSYLNLAADALATIDRSIRTVVNGAVHYCPESISSQVNGQVEKYAPSLQKQVDAGSKAYALYQRFYGQNTAEGKKDPKNLALAVKKVARETLVLTPKDSETTFRGDTRALADTILHELSFEESLTVKEEKPKVALPTNWEVYSSLASEPVKFTARYVAASTLYWMTPDTILLPTITYYASWAFLGLNYYGLYRAKEAPKASALLEEGRVTAITDLIKGEIEAKAKKFAITKESLEAFQTKIGGWATAKDVQKALQQKAPIQKKDSTQSDPSSESKASQSQGNNEPIEEGDPEPSVEEQLAEWQEKLNRATSTITGFEAEGELDEEQQVALATAKSDKAEAIFHVRRLKKGDTDGLTLRAQAEYLQSVIALHETSGDENNKIEAEIALNEFLLFNAKKPEKQHELQGKLIDLQIEKARLEGGDVIEAQWSKVNHSYGHALKNTDYPTAGNILLDMATLLLSQPFAETEGGKAQKIKHFITLDKYMINFAENYRQITQYLLANKSPDNTDQLNEILMSNIDQNVAKKKGAIEAELASLDPARAQSSTVTKPAKPAVAAPVARMPSTFDGIFSFDTDDNAIEDAAGAISSSEAPKTPPTGRKALVFPSTPDSRKSAVGRGSAAPTPQMPEGVPSSVPSSTESSAAPTPVIPGLPGGPEATEEGDAVARNLTEVFTADDDDDASE